MKKFIILLAATLLFGACENDDNDAYNNPDITKKAERTVLIYMAANNNLSKLAALDLKEMKEGSKKLDEQQNLIVYVDLPNPMSSYIARIKDGELVDSTFMEESISSDPAMLERMLRYTREKYPAQSYGLALWGHANGWIVWNDSVAYAKSRAYGLDEEQNKNYWMNIPSMARAIANGMNGDHLHFIFADCCNFACIESAYELRNVTDYLIGSPAEIPEEGAPYQLTIPTLFNTSETFYETIINTYYDFYIEDIKNRPSFYYNWIPGDLEGFSVPLAVIKSDELDNLALATAHLLSTIHDKLAPNGSFNCDGALMYGCLEANKFAYDIYHTLSLNTAESDFNNWKLVFMRAVPYRRHSQQWLSSSFKLRLDMDHFNVKADDCGVVSMFFPNINYEETAPNWNIAIRHFQWNNVIRWQQYGW